MMKRFLLFFLAVISFLGSPEAHAQLVPTTNQTAAQLANKLVGPGVQILNPTLNCPGAANALFTTGAIATTLGMDSGIVLTSGAVANASFNLGISNPASSFASTGNGTPGDVALSQLSSLATFDACILEFDFRPLGDTIRFKYKFGSEEYPEYACTGFNDVFGFFISGPGINGQQNIAKIPGTNLPVSINTVNSAPVGTGPISYCQQYPGAPVATYYINNSASTSIVYDGTTTILEAVSAVTPCQTYHLKLGIADGGDGSYDSGVFLKAGSLVSTNIQLTPVGGGGLANPKPYAVRGCLPGRFFFRRQYPRPTPLTIKFQIGGTATNGVDYTQIADSVVIPADDTIAYVNIFALAQTTPQPLVENVKLYLYPPGCGATGVLVDSTELEIRDSFFVSLLTPDTVICNGQSFQIQTSGDSLMSFNWTPAVGLDNPNSPRPIASPIVTTTYNASINLPGSGCANVNRRITIAVKQPPLIDAGPDTTVCAGSPYTLPTTVTTAVPAVQGYTYNWTGGGGLNNTTVKNPVFTATAPGNAQFILVVNSGAIGCTAIDTVNFRVLPGSISLSNRDTVVCKGFIWQADLTGDTGYKYSWTPTAGVSNPNALRPFLKPDTSTLYTVTASFPGCTTLRQSVKIDVEPVPTVSLGADRQKCQWDTLQILPVITPAFNSYTYTWTPANAVVNPTLRNVIFNAQDSTKLVLEVRTPAGCKGSDSMNIAVFKGNFGRLAGRTDVSICPLDTVTYVASGGVSYSWSPAVYLSGTTDSAVIARAVTDVNYAVTITDVHGCTDTLYAAINVLPGAILNLPDSVVLYPGDSAILVAQGNASSYTWFPGTGLSATNISNPVATPTVDTRYIVQAITEAGCTVSDSVNVLVRRESVLAFPNAFAPGSGPNGRLKIMRQGIASLNYLRIFNRWGNTVFETKNIDEGWDGAFNGAEQPMGVYIYQVDAITPTGRRFTQQGTITLIR